MRPTRTSVLNSSATMRNQWKIAQRTRLTSEGDLYSFSAGGVGRGPGIMPESAGLAALGEYFSGSVEPLHVGSGAWEDMLSIHHVLNEMFSCLRVVIVH